VCLSVRLSQHAALSKRCKLGSRNLYCVLHKNGGLFLTKFLAAGEEFFVERGGHFIYFTGIDSSSVKKVADWHNLLRRPIITSIADKLVGNTNIDNFERP